uniref:Uncharacterized protein n=1 Tax=Cacopsylla melanoneura TaxID=428564 RepID=A0A8D9AAL6_9HEMI
MRMMERDVIKVTNSTGACPKYSISPTTNTPRSSSTLTTHNGSNICLRSNPWAWLFYSTHAISIRRPTIHSSVVTSLARRCIVICLYLLLIEDVCVSWHVR